MVVTGLGSPFLGCTNTQVISWAMGRQRGGMELRGPEATSRTTVATLTERLV